MIRDTEIRADVIAPAPPSQTAPDLSHLQQAMLDITPDCIKVLGVDGTLITMNRAGCVALGVPEHSGFGMPWLSLLPETVRKAGHTALGQAARGCTARFAGQSASSAGTSYWDNLLTPVTDASGQVVSILCVSRDVTAQTRLEQQLERAVAREKLLANEMQHRIKNLFTVVAGLISLAEKESTAAPPGTSATTILRDKLAALARASDAAFLDTPECGDERADLATVVASVMQPYGARCTTAGPVATVLRSVTTTLALVLHELATNAVKYGALSGESGQVSITWTLSGGALTLTWVEANDRRDRDEPCQRGFGTTMVDRIVQAVGGTVDRCWTDQGLTVTIDMPDSVATA
ncbi:signal transduction histidine kinase [Ameyamaea chiangmaiensis NBRC 103196]|uniref:histidine kinase n=1 Tax=Ameyamaea chiangmaiensis TaxID=442969 RepID=A0A850PI89_9PROT|nr:PAS domain-containing protein [Ameyamaea chiangmaiensis]MBS4076269.1 PAS domain-containing protein [Ameyamaea chiangmaiensis]NVN41956.1 PAS domain-containing protein [Ameyamaea chiangmaiensis]GBQ64769.1 signal transduction histidine kinase [Ameyamaea chiangmaiensis NBRC 103196]